MIVPMKKAIILCETKDAEATVRHLRHLGVIHIEHENLPEGKDISELRARSALITSAIDVLNQAGSRVSLPQMKIQGDRMAAVQHIIDLGKKKEQLESLAGVLAGHIREWERWGDVDADQVKRLKGKGVYLSLYRVPVKESGNFPGDVVVRTLFTENDIAHCVTLSQRPIECPFEEITPPRESLSVLRSRLAETDGALDGVHGEILESARYAKDLSEIREELEKDIEFQQVIHGMGREGAFSYATGYIPCDSEENLIATARAHHWGIMIRETSAEDAVPTLLRNNRWVRMIEPVLGFLGLTPGYHELDVSLPFLIFFAIFFGILIGDAGYGLVYILGTLLLTIWLWKTMRLNVEMKTMVSLFFVLSFSAVVWGVLTGVFFGQEWLLNLGYEPPAPRLNDPVFIQTLCFFIGALHLSIAHSWRAYLKFPSLMALADAGYICILWTAFFLANTLVLGEPFPSWGIGLVVTGILLVILFTNPQRHVLRGIGEGLGTMALSFMNNITDVISYVRLFAVGLATLAIAETANALASDVSGFGTGIMAVAAGIVVLIIGHGLNLVLGLMSVLVHGVRLNVLEFSGHANVAWSGVAFKPFEE